MATIKLDWQRVQFPATVSGWVALRNHVRKNYSDTMLQSLCDSRTVYVIRVCRPFLFSYKMGESPTIYIGRGHFQQRLTSHIKNWICPISKQIPNLKIEVLSCKPRVKHLANAFVDAEKDIIARFTDKFNEKPIKNTNSGFNYDREHQYYSSELNQVWRKGQGRGYHWVLTPAASSPLARS